MVLIPVWLGCFVFRVSQCVSKDLALRSSGMCSLGGQARNTQVTPVPLEVPQLHPSAAGLLLGHCPWTLRIMLTRWECPGVLGKYTPAVQSSGSSDSGSVSPGICVEV